MVEINEIRKKMSVLDARGNHVGFVEKVHNESEIKLSRADSPDGLHHYIPLDWIASIDRSIHLKRSGAEVVRDRD